MWLPWMGDEGAPSLTAEEEGICTAMQAASFGRIVSKMLILFEQMRKRSFKPLSDFPMVFIWKEGDRLLSPTLHFLLLICSLLGLRLIAK